LIRSRLGAVLRARQAQEDAAKGEVLRARRASRAAHKLARQQEQHLDQDSLPDEGVARAIIAALAARQALAADLSAAKQAAIVADEETGERVGELGEAAKRRRAVERLLDRQLEEQRRSALAADQRVLDEIAGTGHQRAAALGVSRGES
jgi:flagellar biosynthesis chaperone FliJ